MKDDVVLQLDGVKKDFKLPHYRTATLKTAVLSTLRGRGRGRGSGRVERQRALKGVSFEVKKGEFFGVVGRNGSGKSTLLKLLAGIYQPSSGSIAVSGKLVPFIELGVGFNPELTGRENVYLNGAILGFSKKQVTEMYDSIVAFSELERFMDQKLKNYSSGMQVRLAFSVAIQAKAEILLIDEVLAVGDASFQRKCFNYFKELKLSDTTVIFVSHDMSAVREYCDRAVLIEAGKVQAIGDTDKVATEYTKLFTEETTSGAGKAIEGGGWGDGPLHTTSVKVTSEDNEVLVKQVIANPSKGAVVPALGIRVRTAAGFELTGMSTRQYALKVPEVKPGGQISVTWKLPNGFSDGSYIIDLAVHGDDGVSVMHWLDEAAEFKIHKLPRIPYPVDAGISVEFR